MPTPALLPSAAISTDRVDPGATVAVQRWNVAEAQFQSAWLVATLAAAALAIVAAYVATTELAKRRFYR